MNNDRETASVQSVLEALGRGLHARDAEAIGAQFTSDAKIFDLAPPLAHTLDTAGLATWLAGWGGPVEQRWRDRAISFSGDLAFCHGLCHVRTVTKADGQPVEWWHRMTVCLRRVNGEWKIVHEHSSVPFYMDGSYRAAIDLQP